MTEVYACLAGEWVCLNSDDNCGIGPNHLSPNTWYEENAEIFSSNSKQEHTYYQLDYVHIYFKGVDYRINPIFIQIVTK